MEKKKEQWVRVHHREKKKSNGVRVHHGEQKKEQWGESSP